MTDMPVNAWKFRHVGGLHGSLALPGDKSISHRAAILGALALGHTKVTGWLPAEDCRRTAEILGRLGVAISIDGSGTVIDIEGVGLKGLKPPKDDRPLDCGNSGTTMRLMLGVLAAHPFKAILTGDKYLCTRPMRRIIEPLRAMGARLSASDEDQHAPVEIMGGDLTGKTFELPVASAQLKSALLLAGLQAEGETRVREPALSRDHTERQLLRLGAAYSKNEEGWHSVKGGVQFHSRPMRVPGDLSSSAAFLAAAAICPRSEIEIREVGVNPGRSGFLEVLKRMGARITVVNERESDGEPVADIVMRGGAPLKGARVSGDLIPRLLDEIPVLAALACYADGVTVIRNAEELRVKESDRIASMASELSKMGAKVGTMPDGLAIEGGAPLKGAEVESHGDHRIAQALAVAALGAEGETTILDIDCVATSYPAFEADLRSLAGSR